MVLRGLVALLVGVTCVLAQSLIVNGGLEDPADVPPYFPGWDDTTWLPQSRDDHPEAVAGGSFSASARPRLGLTRAGASSDSIVASQPCVDLPRGS